MAESRPIRRALDVSSSASAAAALEGVKADVGPPDVLVNNAGIDVIKPFVDTTEDDWHRVIAVNFGHDRAPCRARRHDRAASGRIVNIASDAGRVGSSGEAVYSATKGGVIAFTKTLAREVAPRDHGQRVCPGPDRDGAAGAGRRVLARSYAGLARAIPMGAPPSRRHRPGSRVPGRPTAGYITGQTLSVSGGLTMA